MKMKGLTLALMLTAGLGANTSSAMGKKVIEESPVADPVQPSVEIRAEAFIVSGPRHHYASKNSEN